MCLVSFTCNNVSGSVNVADVTFALRSFVAVMQYSVLGSYHRIPSVAVASFSLDCVPRRCVLSSCPTVALFGKSPG